MNIFLQRSRRDVKGLKKLFFHLMKSINSFLFKMEENGIKSFSEGYRKRKIMRESLHRRECNLSKKFSVS